jgi:hypothetical protein
MSTHLLSTKNHFAVLSVDEMTESDLISSTDSAENNVQAVPQLPSCKGNLTISANIVRYLQGKTKVSIGTSREYNTTHLAREIQREYSKDHPAR